MDAITIAPGVEVHTDGHTLTLREGDTTIACNQNETFGLLGALRFALGLNADEFEVADGDDGPVITLNHEAQTNLLDTLEAARAADDDEDWD